MEQIIKETTEKLSKGIITKDDALEICPDDKTKVSDLPKEIKSYFK